MGEWVSYVVWWSGAQLEYNFRARGLWTLFITLKDVARNLYWSIMKSQSDYSALRASVAGNSLCYWQPFRIKRLGETSECVHLCSASATAMCNLLLLNVKRPRHHSISSTTISLYTWELLDMFYAYSDNIGSSHLHLEINQKALRHLYKHSPYSRFKKWGLPIVWTPRATFKPSVWSLF